MMRTFQPKFAEVSNLFFASRPIATQTLNPKQQTFLQHGLKCRLQPPSSLNPRLRVRAAVRATRPRTPGKSAEQWIGTRAEGHLGVISGHYVCVCACVRVCDVQLYKYITTNKINMHICRAYIYIYICVCVCMYMYVCIYIYIYILIHVFIYLFIHLCIYIYISIYVSICVCMYIYIYVCIYIYIYV